MDQSTGSSDWAMIARDLAAALQCCSDQLIQVKGMFPNDDAMALALSDADEAIEAYLERAVAE